MEKKISSYNEYEQKFKKQLYQVACIVTGAFCAIYLYQTINTEQTILTIANTVVIVLALLGLITLKFAKNISSLHIIPGCNYLVLFFGGLLGAYHLDATTNLMYCLLFLPSLVLTIGHRSSLPYIMLAQGACCYVFFVDSSLLINASYSQQDKNTYLLVSNILLTLVWFTEYVRFTLAHGLLTENEEKRRIEYLSSHDELTSVFNRRGFRDHLANHNIFTKRDGDQYAVILLDIDNFKQVNDLYGHAFGDIVLKKIARLQLGTVRSTDKVVRWGGEEFLILLSNIKENQVKRIAENIRKNIEKTPVSTPQITINITVSIGIAFSGETDDIDSLIELADKRLYRAKKQGKNRIAAECSLTEAQSASELRLYY